MEQKFYGVAVGHVPGVYEDWPTAQAQVSGVKGPKYKKFTTRAEAEAFVRGVTTEPAVKKARTSTESSTSIVSLSSSSGQTSKVRSKAESTTSSGQVIRVYTDGSSLGNGKVGSRAGVGVFFGVNDPRYGTIKFSPIILLMNVFQKRLRAITW